MAHFDDSGSSYRSVRFEQFVGDFSILCQLSCTLLSSALARQMFDGETSFYLFLKSQNFENSQVVLGFFLRLVRLYSSYGRRNNDHLSNNDQLVACNSTDTLVSFQEIFLISCTNSTLSVVADIPEREARRVSCNHGEGTIYQ